MDRPDITLATLMKEPMLRALPNEPIDPIDSAEPREPIDRTLSWE